jgi:flagellar motor switch protein FliN/FliY
MAKRKAKARGKAKGTTTGRPTKAAPSPPAAAAPATPSDTDHVRLTMTIEVGRTREVIGTIHEFGEQSLVELDRTVDEPVDILLNGELWARGEVVTVDQNFGVRVTEIVRPVGQ